MVQLEPSKVGIHLANVNQNCQYCAFDIRKVLYTDCYFMQPYVRCTFPSQYHLKLCEQPINIKNESDPLGYEYNKMSILCDASIYQ